MSGYEKDVVGHLLVEIWMLLHNFLNSSATNIIIAKVVSSRKREVGLVVSAKYTALTKIGSLHKF